jgi:hypothetical protein
MKKIIRLTESELISVVKKIIKENEEEWISSMEDIEGESDFSKMESKIINTSKKITKDLPKEKKDILKTFIEKRGIDEFNKLVTDVFKKQKNEVTENENWSDQEKLLGFTYGDKEKLEDYEIARQVIEDDVLTSILYNLGYVASFLALPTAFISVGVAAGLGLFSIATRLLAANTAKNRIIAKNKERREKEKQKELQKESRIINSIRKKIKRYE